ncbi:MAG TPA: L-histidine N(alpha)-methyltransferase [Terriglobales bacterium]|jgi:dimethylhistidine N-methyltransferase|nr:L-histidine N(alpha)-methyltransferase [Terriglobales bacterium]
MIARELVVAPPYAEEVFAGLTGSPKSLPCKLFYDSVGSALFEEITELPEYYPTRTELQILRERSSEIARAAGPGINVIELGAGTAAKTCTLLQAIARRQIWLRYFPVDISPAALSEARQRVEDDCSNVTVRPVVVDFSNGFSFLRELPGPKLVLYLGSSIGNFDPSAAVAMLKEIRKQLTVRDALLLGTDLVKDQSILVPAYDDTQGVTAKFNKNILCRLNRELGATFDLSCFRHVACWNPEQSCIQIYLESLRPQIAEIPFLNLRVRFEKGERIHTENSYKYTLPMIKNMLKPAEFSLTKTWYDERKWFALHLARAT